jgi:hypothetical protein
VYFAWLRVHRFYAWGEEPVPAAQPM